MRRFSVSQAHAAFELQQMLCDYAADLDLNDCHEAHTYFTEDGEFLPGGPPMHGRAAIAAFYERRNANAQRLLKDGIRTARHTFANVRVEFTSDDCATIRCTQINYAGEGESPVFGLAGPGIVADCRIDCRRQPDGAWLFARMAATPALIGEDSFMHKMMAEAAPPGGQGA